MEANQPNEVFETIKTESLEIEENEFLPSVTKIKQRRRNRNVSRRREGKSQLNTKQTDADTIKILRRKVTRLQVENRRLRDIIRTSRCINRMSQKAQIVFEAFNFLHKKAGPDLSMFDSIPFDTNDRPLLVPPPATLMEEPHVILSTSMESVPQNGTDQMSLAVRKDIFEDGSINSNENLPYVNGIQSNMDAHKVQYDSTTDRPAELANSRIQNPFESVNPNTQYGNDITSNPAELILGSPAHSMWGQPVVPKKGMVLDCVDLSGILVLKESLEKCNTTKASKLTIDLMSILFTPDEMADSSLTGKPSNIHKFRSPDQVRPKVALNPLRTKALFAYVKEKFPGTDDQSIKNVLKSKLKYEAQKKYGVGFTKPRHNKWEQSADDRYEANQELFYQSTEMQCATKTEYCIPANNTLRGEPSVNG